MRNYFLSSWSLQFRKFFLQKNMFLSWPSLCKPRASPSVRLNLIFKSQNTYRYVCFLFLIFQRQKLRKPGFCFLPPKFSCCKRTTMYDTYLQYFKSSFLPRSQKTKEKYRHLLQWKKAIPWRTIQSWFFTDIFSPKYHGGDVKCFWQYSLGKRQNNG